MVNGVRPQINCNVCNTGDIHINGLEGPYTMVTIDGMPIVSSLATGEPYDIYKDGLRIYTTINPRMQIYAEEAVAKHI